MLTKIGIGIYYAFSCLLSHSIDDQKTLQYKIVHRIRAFPARVQPKSPFARSLAAHLQTRHAHLQSHFLHRFRQHVVQRLQMNITLRIDDAQLFERTRHVALERRIVVLITIAELFDGPLRDARPSHACIVDGPHVVDHLGRRILENRQTAVWRTPECALGYLTVSSRRGGGLLLCNRTDKTIVHTKRTMRKYIVKYLDNVCLHPMVD